MGSTNGADSRPGTSQVAGRGAPPPLDLVQNLVNTRNLMRGTDRLTLAAGGGDIGGADIGGADMETLRDLRETLRSVLLPHTTGQPVDPTAVDRLRELAAAAPLRAKIGADGSAVPTAMGDDAVAEALAAMISAGQAGTWRRLKVCANPECRWAFYDTSRNRSSTWCDMSICGSRVKMRAYRRRTTGS